jgi:hypothetical protein
MLDAHTAHLLGVLLGKGGLVEKQLEHLSGTLANLIFLLGFREGGRQAEDECERPFNVVNWGIDLTGGSVLDQHVQAIGWV